MPKAESKSKAQWLVFALPRKSLIDHVLELPSLGMGQESAGDELGKFIQPARIFRKLLAKQCSFLGDRLGIQESQSPTEFRYPLALLGKLGLVSDV
jgi:hypothetical protein